MFSKMTYVDENGWTYTTHPFNEYNGDGVTLTEFFATLRDQYIKEGKEIKELLTYHNSGFNHNTQTQEKEAEFGVEVIWK